MPYRGPRFQPTLEPVDQHSEIQFSNTCRPSGLVLNMAPTDRYSVILPTYNERRNLPIICWLVEKTFREK